MNIRDVRNGRYTPQPGVSERSPRVVSRRQFVRGIAGAAVLGATFGSGLLRPKPAQASGSSDPLPVVGGWSVLNPYHVYAPFFDGRLNSEPATISNFNGSVGLAYISGSVTRTNTKTGEVRTLPMVDSDMRFMKGVYVGQDGREHRGAFSLV